MKRNQLQDSDSARAVCYELEWVKILFNNVRNIHRLLRRIAAGNQSKQSQLEITLVGFFSSFIERHDCQVILHNYTLIFVVFFLARRV